MGMKSEINFANVTVLPVEKIIVETDCPHAGQRPYH